MLALFVWKLSVVHENVLLPLSSLCLFRGAPLSCHPSMMIWPLYQSSIRQMTGMRVVLQSLALAHVNINDDIVSFTPWTETDFRDGSEPWWT